MKKYYYLLFILCLIFNITSCKNKEDENKKIIIEPEICNHDTSSTWKYPSDARCNEQVTACLYCDNCGELLDAKLAKMPHDLVEEYLAPTCTEDGYTHTYCTKGDVDYTVKEPATGHLNTYYVIDIKADDKSNGRKHKECDDCGMIFGTVDYAANGYSDHGKLSVDGTKLVDKNGNPFQLVGISTHGLQWASQYINYDIIDNLHNEFGINVLRLSLYPAEGGYLECSASYKEFLYNLVCNGIDICTKLDMYAIVDWHMLGSADPCQGNPLYYKEEAKEFFDKISKDYKDHDNVLYEIMNEPCGTTTWEQCKIYANQVIPVIRNNDKDAIILVGNPHWSADLVSVKNSPLQGYDNIMYTYHFYANGATNFNAITSAIKAGIPVFVSEHGGMQDTGDGPLDEGSTLAWYKVLEENKISYVAWNLSNTKGSASIQKWMSGDYTNFKDENLKEWGIWYKNWVRKKFGLDTD